MATKSATTLSELPSPEEATTPLLSQYCAIKAAHKDCLLFFRLGDFYEMFFEDAVQAARALDLALTHRGTFQGQDIPMCGVPFHAYENYLARLIRQGFRVAICEQVEDPAEAKKRGSKSIVRREVVRIVTPGTVTEDSLLESRAANHLLCLVETGGEKAAGWIDLSASQPFGQSIAMTELSALLARLDPSEILISEKTAEAPEWAECLAPWKTRLTLLPPARFDSENARRKLEETYGVDTMDSFGSFSRAETAALGSLVDYVSLTQKSDLSHLLPPRTSGANEVLIDAATQRNLELIRNQQGERQGSLLWAVDRTQTGAGARLLASRLVSPLTDAAEIHARLDAVSFGVQRSAVRGKIRDLLRQTPDLERALARLSLSRGGPRDLAAVREALIRAAEIRSVLLAESDAPSVWRGVAVSLGEHSETVDRLTRALASDLPLLARDGNFIAQGFSPALDELTLLRDDSRRLIVALQQKYTEASGVQNLKIKHNQVIGFFIEVTALHADKLLAQRELFIHRQSMAGAVRFTTVELGELERKINEASGRALALELQLFDELVGSVVGQIGPLRETASALAVADVEMSLAEVAVEQNYARPAIDNSLAFEIKGGRHPVVEQALRGASESFVGNDCDLTEHKRLWLLTGPNMAGKSTFLRQNALIAILAQCGSFVPAASAHIGVVDRLFSRVGAADDLARGRSTFMVEMVETAAILNQAGRRALVILDEIGRGTATYDGLSIAWATVEHLHDANQCRALFATHYHELTALSGQLSALHCATMKIKEWQNKIIFLHEIADGTADRSYGLHVAQMAGLPAAVIRRADQVLKSLEAEASAKGDKNKAALADLPLFVAAAPKVEAAPPIGPSLAPELEKILSDTNPDDLSPKQALETLYQIKKIWGKGA
jgi:DNA mismatch repair protein MutS